MKRFISMLLALAMTFSLVGPAYQPPSSVIYADEPETGRVGEGEIPINTDYYDIHRRTIAYDGADETNEVQIAEKPEVLEPGQVWIGKSVTWVPTDVRGQFIIKLEVAV